MATGFSPEKKSKGHALSTMDLDSEENKGQTHQNMVRFEQLQLRVDQSVATSDNNDDMANQE